MIINILIIALLIWVVCVALYTSISQPDDTVSIRGATDYFDGFYSNRTLLEVNRIHEYALLSEVVYDRLDNNGKRLNYNDIALQELEGKTIPATTELEDLWKKVDEEFVSSLLRDEANSTYNIDSTKNFHMEVYVRDRPNQNGKTEIALVYRGTDGLKDFYSNFHWITRFIPNSKNQYDIARIVTPELIDKLPQFLELVDDEIEYIATGHSLGGGLAQMAAYSDARVRIVYAFDSTAVTGFFDAPRSTRLKAVKKLRIYRIHAWGEVLAYMRSVMRILWPVVTINPQIMEVRYRISPDDNKKSVISRLKDNFISKHSMGKLAIGIRDAWLVSTEKNK